MGGKYRQASGFKCESFADGEIVRVNSSMSTIHDQFGETWSVEKKDWIFKHRPFYKEILKDLEEGSSYKASYALSFETTEQEEEAREVSFSDPLELFC